MLSADRPATRFATRLLFLVAGFGYACWAALVPLTKIKFDIDENLLGLLILCIGVGSITAMVATGMLATRFGSKPILPGSGFGFAIMLALVPVAGAVPVLGIILFGFGATLGALDVAMNLQAVQVEKAARRPMMSGFHVPFSIGGFRGAAFMTFLLSMHLAVLTGTLTCAALMALALCIAAPRLLNGGATLGGGDVRDPARPGAGAGDPGRARRDRLCCRCVRTACGVLDAGGLVGVGATVCQGRHCEGMMQTNMCRFMHSCG